MELKFNHKLDDHRQLGITKDENMALIFRVDMFYDAIRWEMETNGRIKNSIVTEIAFNLFKDEPKEVLIMLIGCVEMEKIRFMDKMIEKINNKEKETKNETLN